MKILKSNWITEQPIDFEYKKYILLAYLQSVDKHFSEDKLYPGFSDLIKHLRSLTDFQSARSAAKEGLSKELSEIDWEELRLKYKMETGDSEFLDVIDDVIEYSLPLIRSTAHTGKEVYERIEETVTLEPVGLLPVNRDFGYFFLCDDLQGSAHIFNYELSMITLGAEKHRALKTKWLKQVGLSLKNTLDRVKAKLVEEFKLQNIPATYRIASKTPIPLNETYLPIAKRMLVRHLQNGEAA